MARVLGLDLGSHTVKAVELRPRLRGVDVVQLRAVTLGAESPPLPEVLRDLVRSHDLSTEHVVCALPGDRVSTRALRFPFRDRRRIEKAVPFEVEGATPFDLEEIVVDWLPTGGDRSSSEVCAAVAPRVEVAWLLENLSQAGIDPRVVEAEGLALANLAGLFALPGTRVLADLGHRKTTLCLLRDGRPLAARTLPIGGRALTEAVAKDRHAELPEAERFKCEEGVFGPDLEPRCAGAVAILDRLARELVRSLGAFEPLLGGPSHEQLDELTLIGGTAHLHRIDDYLSGRIGIRAARLALPSDPSLLAAGDPLIFAQALALALRATPLARTRMSFRQAEFAQRLDLGQLRQQLRPTAWLLGATAALALAAGATQMAVNGRRAAALERRTAEIYAQALPNAPPAASPVAGMREAVRRARERADFLGVYGGGNLSSLDVLTEIAARVPEEVEIVVEDLRIDGAVVRLRAFAGTVEVLDRLEAELADFESFAQVKVDDIKDDARRTGYTFNLTISLDAGDAL